MKKSVFSAAKLAGLTAVNRGTKSSNDIRPAITTARGMNKFTMNASASALIGCGHGDRVVMFAMPNADSINERFFIVNGSEKILNHIRTKLNIKDGETTADGLFTLKPAECLVADAYAG